jgi:hypothetical protein
MGANGVHRHLRRSWQGRTRLDLATATERQLLCAVARSGVRGPPRTPSGLRLLRRTRRELGAFPSRTALAFGDYHAERRQVVRKLSPTLRRAAGQRALQPASTNEMTIGRISGSRGDRRGEVGSPSPSRSRAAWARNVSKWSRTIWCRTVVPGDRGSYSREANAHDRLYRRGVASSRTSEIRPQSPPVLDTWAEFAMRASVEIGISPMPETSSARPAMVWMRYRGVRRTD